MCAERKGLVSRIQKTIDSYAPALGRLYRQVRDVAVNRRAHDTQYNFTLAGEPLVVAEGWESAEIAVFLELLESHDAVIDVGANVGCYSCLAASRHKRVVAVEPSPRNLAYLKRNLWVNGFLKVEVFPVGRWCSARGLNRIYGFGGTASFVEGWGQAGKNASVVVPVTTLDTICAAMRGENKLLIKIDVEGFEYEVLAGASQTLDNEPRPTWLVEIILRGDDLPGGRNARFGDTFDVFWNRDLSVPTTRRNPCHSYARGRDTLDSGRPRQYCLSQLPFRCS